MVTFVVKTKMHYPVMTEQQVAARWKVSLKTMRRWRQDKVGPTWHKLFHHVRYHEVDVFDFEQQSAQHWQAILGERERVPRIVTHPPKDSAAPAEQDATNTGAPGKKIPTDKGWDFKLWWSGRGSNPRPSRCERDALPAELPPHEQRRHSNIRHPGCNRHSDCEPLQ